jgi:hypothetical protein
MIKLLAALLGKNAYDKIVTMSQNEHQQSVNDFWSCILDNLTAMECRLPTVNLSAAFIGKNASDDIASGSYNWVPTQRQLFWWMLRILHSNEVYCDVPKLSCTRSVFAICHCIQLPKYACNVLQIWWLCLFCLFVIILHSPQRGAQLSYHKPADHWWSWHLINIFIPVHRKLPVHPSAKLRPN